MALRILISGACGFIGKPLSSYLRSLGHEVVPLSRRKEKDSIFWDPIQKQADPRSFAHFDAVIHLAGEPLSLNRWNSEKKRAIFTSRVDTTHFLVELLLESRSLPSVFLSASAVGFYGDRKEELLDESSPPGKGFLATVCAEWEKACIPLKERKVRCVSTRFGIVLGPKGGSLAKMIPLFRLGMGARLGSGEQWVSWIQLDDLVSALSFCLHHPTLYGPLNLVSLEPVRQKKFAALLAQLLHRPCLFSLPSWFLKIVLGQSAEELLLSSQKVTCSKILAENFTFRYPDLRSALLHSLQ